MRRPGMTIISSLGTTDEGTGAVLTDAGAEAGLTLMRFASLRLSFPSVSSWWSSRFLLMASFLILLVLVLTVLISSTLMVTPLLVGIILDESLLEFASGISD